MMNPREKALLLCQKMGWTSFSNIEMDNATLPIDVAKKCASIAVVELIDEWQQALNISLTAYSIISKAQELRQAQSKAQMLS